MSQTILPAEVSNTIMIQLNEHPRRNELSKYTQNPRLTFHEVKTLLFHGPFVLHRTGPTTIWHENNLN